MFLNIWTSWGLLIELFWSAVLSYWPLTISSNPSPNLMDKNKNMTIHETPDKPWHIHITVHGRTQHFHCPRIITLISFCLPIPIICCIDMTPHDTHMIKLMTMTPWRPHLNCCCPRVWCVLVCDPSSRSSPPPAWARLHETTIAPSIN